MLLRRRGSTSLLDLTLLGIRRDISRSDIGRRSSVDSHVRHPRSSGMRLIVVVLVASDLGFLGLVVRGDKSGDQVGLFARMRESASLEDVFQLGDFELVVRGSCVLFGRAGVRLVATFAFFVILSVGCCVVVVGRNGGCGLGGRDDCVRCVI